MTEQPFGLQQTDTELSRQFGPPSLSAEGLRVQPQWLYSFIKDPDQHPIRPFLHPKDFFGEKVPDERRAIWEATRSINLDGVWNTLEAAIPRMIERGNGLIVNVSW